MSRKMFLLVIPAVNAMFWGAFQGVAQAPAQPPAQPTTASDNSNGQSNGPQKGCQSGKLRCTTNDDRWKAAIRNADRDAEDFRRQGQHPSKGKK